MCFFAKIHRKQAAHVVQIASEHWGSKFAGIGAYDCATGDVIRTRDLYAFSDWLANREWVWIHCRRVETMRIRDEDIQPIVTKEGSLAFYAGPVSDFRNYVHSQPGKSLFRVMCETFQDCYLREQGCVILPQKTGEKS